MNNGRKITGGKYHALRKTKKFERRGQQRVVALGEDKRKSIRGQGGHARAVLLKSNKVNIVLNGKVKKADIINVEETPQNKFFARQNRLMKSAIITTTLGRARITNRPSQEGCVNAMLIEEKK